MDYLVLVVLSDDVVLDDEFWEEEDVAAGELNLEDEALDVDDEGLEEDLKDEVLRTVEDEFDMVRPLELPTELVLEDKILGLVREELDELELSAELDVEDEILELIRVELDEVELPVELDVGNEILELIRAELDEVELSVELEFEDEVLRIVEEGFDDGEEETVREETLATFMLKRGPELEVDDGDDDVAGADGADIAVEPAVVCDELDFEDEVLELDGLKIDELFELEGVDEDKPLELSTELTEEEESEAAEDEEPNEEVSLDAVDPEGVEEAVVDPLVLGLDEDKLALVTTDEVDKASVSVLLLALVREVEMEAEFDFEMLELDGDRLELMLEKDEEVVANEPPLELDGAELAPLDDDEEVVVVGK